MRSVGGKAVPPSVCVFAALVMSGRDLASAEPASFLAF
ncbi:hypothetical protein PATSB16_13690 [Pandoraea thiooxydans]|nr:hypothetical protein PATSB16_13690 [Pandoraea thiooxydans]